MLKRCWKVSTWSENLIQPMPNINFRNIFLLEISDQNIDWNTLNKIHLSILSLVSLPFDMNQNKPIEFWLKEKSNSFISNWYVRGDFCSNSPRRACSTYRWLQMCFQLVYWILKRSSKQCWYRLLVQWLEFKYLWRSIISISDCSYRFLWTRGFYFSICSQVYLYVTCRFMLLIIKYLCIPHRAFLSLSKRH